MAVFMNEVSGEAMISPASVLQHIGRTSEEVITASSDGWTVLRKVVGC